MFVTSVTIEDLPEAAELELTRAMEELAQELHGRAESSLIQAHLLRHDTRVVLMAFWRSREALQAAMRSPAGQKAMRIQAQFLSAYGADFEELDVRWVSLPASP